jgi:hypothetical protein
MNYLIILVVFLIGLFLLKKNVENFESIFGDCECKKEQQKYAGTYIESYPKVDIDDYVI